MDAQKLQELVEEADEIEAADPGYFESREFNQPPGDFVREAEELLGSMKDDGTPWHQVAYVAHAIKDEEEASLYEL